MSIYANGELVAKEQVKEKDLHKFDESCFPNGRKIRERTQLLQDPFLFKKRKLVERDEEEYVPDEDGIEPGIYDDPEDEGSVPSEFEFNSRVIFISNLTKVPDALADRCVSIEMNFTKEQIIEYIKTKLNDVIKGTNATIEDAVDAWNFINKYLHVAKKVSFRLFQYVLSMKTSGNPDWQRMSYIFMKSSFDPSAAKKK
jgi:hypothetical protein